jgi:hypothetical protein
MSSSKVKAGSKLYPTDPVAAAEGALSAWFSLTNSGATVTGAGYSSVPDLLDASNPATQSTDARRPTNQTSNNGLPIMTWPGSGNQVLASPLTTARNGASQWGCAAWVRLADVAGNFRSVVTILNATGGASADKVAAHASTTEYRLNAYAANTDGRRAESPAATALAATWQFVTFEFDSTGGSEAARSAISIDGVAQALDFSSIGTGTVPTSLVVPTTNLLIGSGANAASSSLVFSGSMGPNLYLFGAKMASAGVGLLTQQARLALMNYQRPT